MRSTRVSPSKFFGDRYTQYVDELTADGTLAGKKLTPAQRKEGFKKRGDKISFEKFVDKVLEKNTGPAMSGANKALPGNGRGGAIVKSSGIASQPFISRPISDKGQENLDDILKGIDSILETLKKEEKFKRQVSVKNRRKQERERRATSEDKLEKKGFAGLGTAVSKVLKPVKSIFDRLFDFIFNTILGRVLIKLVDWFSDPENKGKLDAIGRFLKDTWPAILAGFILFGTGIGSFLTGLVGLVTWFLPKILKLTGKLIGVIARNPMKALAVAGVGALGYAAYTGTQASNDPERAAQGKTQLDDNIENLGNMMQGFKFFSAGGRVPGTGTADTVPAMLTPGEFVMTRGAVSKFGLNTMRSMNAAGGGSGVPSLMSNDILGYAQGGLVGGTPGNPRNPKDRKIFLHWSGGFHNSVHGMPYHQTFSGSGKPASTNVNYGADKSKHTAGHNTDSVALGAAAMGHRGMTPDYYDDKKGWAENPLTNAQTTAMAKEAAGLLQAYGQTAADVDRNVWTHGEWERYAVKKGILKPPVQRWDLDSLTPGPYNHPGGFWKTKKVYSKGGDQMRAKVKSFMTGAQMPVTSPEEPKSGGGVVKSPGGGGGGGGGSSYTGSMTETKPKAKVKPMSQAEITKLLEGLRTTVDSPLGQPVTTKPSTNVPDLNAAAKQDSRKRKVMGIA
tara:strand:+ start:877 stop:2898 length:2022 start_codon:yes stop_codon:yes gene_type:complete